MNCILSHKSHSLGGLKKRNPSVSCRKSCAKLFYLDREYCGVARVVSFIIYTYDIVCNPTSTTYHV